ncbi:uncharacterized protein LOC144860416 isoform X2 [Branchiostoma floridae x Branchiostoma japonicum]
MASLSESLTTKLPPVKFHCRQDKTRPKKPPPPTPDGQDGAGVTGKVLRAPDVTASPVIVDFRRLLQSSKSCIDVVPGVPNRDLLHAVVALYDVSLPDVGEEFLYATVCAKWSKTILMLRDSGEVVEELCKSHPVGGTSATSSTQDSGIADGEKGQQGGRGADEKKEDEDKRRFADVFSDSDSSDGSSSDSEEEEDFSAGADDFVQRVRERRQQRRDGRFQPSQGNLGIESRLLACATFERSYCKGEKVVQLHLIAVRRRYRKWGMGRYLLKQVKHPPVVGTYDYLIVHADSSATDFFERFGFSDDVVLNSRFNEFDEQWTNTTMMCYIPPYAGLNGMSSDPELDLKAMELEIRKLREKSLDAYQCQMTCVMRIMHEIVTLQAKLSAQGDIIHTLQDKNDQLQMDKVAQDKRFLDYKLGVMRNMYGSKQDQGDANQSKDMDEDTSGLNTLVSALEEELEKIQQAKEAGLTVGGQEDKMVSRGTEDFLSQLAHTAEWWQVADDFRRGMKKDSDIEGIVEVTNITPAELTASAVESFHTWRQKLQDPSLCMKLYFCGGLEHPTSRMKELIKYGFSEQDFSHGTFGVGLYFSKHPSKAANFCPLGKILLAEVVLGKTESVVKKNHTRRTPPNGYDSVVTPGRLLPSASGDSMVTNQEYLVFHPDQAIPVCLIEYKIVGQSATNGQSK